MTYIYDTHACYVCRNITICSTLFMHGPLPLSDFASFVYDHYIFLYHQCKTQFLLFLVQSPSDCGTLIINNSLLFIETLYFWYLQLCIVYVCIHSTGTICTALSMLGTLPTSACTCRLT